MRRHRGESRQASGGGLEVRIHQPGTPGYTRFWTAIENEAQRLRRSEGLDLHVFHGVEGHVDNEPFQRLVADVTRHRLAGIVFLHTPFQYKHTPLLDEPGIARVAFMADTPEFPTVQAVNTKFGLLTDARKYCHAPGLSTHLCHAGGVPVEIAS